MYFTLTLHFLLITTLSSTSFSHDATQHPFGRIANRPPDLGVRSSVYYGRCPLNHYWCCHYFTYRVYCGCCWVPGNEPSAAGLSYADETVRALAEVQNVTTLQVLTEIQPSNNETLVSLFELRCDSGRQHVACTQTGCGFACGCHDNWNTVDIGTHEHGRPDISDYYEDGSLRRGGRKAAARDVLSSEDGDVEVGQQVKYTDFSFQDYLFPKCRPGLHLKCCDTEVPFGICFCARRHERCEDFEVR